MAVRLSLGAGRFRVVRQLLTESVMLASLGGALGVLFAIWGVRSLTFLLSNGQENFTLHAELNWKVLGVTAALSVVCGLLFGLAPAIQSTRPDVMPALKNGRGGGPRRRAQHVLVVAQIAISFLILFAAGLFVRTLDKLHSVQLGYAQALRIDPRSEQRDAFAILDHQRRPCRGGIQGDNEDRRCYHPGRKRHGRRTAFPHDHADSDPGRA
jgi:hypothetical protein